MNQDLFNLLISEIKSKKQIKDLENKYIEKKLNKFFLTNGNIRKKIEEAYSKKENKIIKDKTFKEIIKNIRQQIGIVYGSYLTQDFNKKEKILNQAKTIEETQEILKFHKSTRERYDYYDQIYNKIFEKIKPKYIADFACGLNPISISIIKEKLNYFPKYFATDLNPKDMGFLNSFFQKFNLEGTAKNSDLTTLEILENEEVKKADTLFLFKAIDSLEQIKKNISKELLEKIPAKNLIISFPTKSLVSRKNFKIEKRNWFFKFLDEKQWKYETFEIEGELFILINKN